MSQVRPVTFRAALALVVIAAVAPLATPAAQSTPPPQRLTTQKLDEQYTALIKQTLTDPRISTELVDHLPASDKVPTPLKFPAVGHISGQPGVLTYAKDIHAYMKAVADQKRQRLFADWLDEREKKATVKVASFYGKWNKQRGSVN